EAAVDSAYSLAEVWFEDDEAVDSAVLVEAWTPEADTLYDEEEVLAKEVELDSLDWNEAWERDGEFYTREHEEVPFPAVEEDGNPYGSYYAADQVIKNELGISWAKKYATSVFEETPEKSILTNQSYLKSL